MRYGISRDSLAGIRHFNERSVGPLSQRHVHAPPGGRILDGVIDEIDQDLAKAQRIRLHLQPRGRRKVQLEFFVLGQQAHLLHGVSAEFGQVEPLPLEFQSDSGQDVAPTHPRQHHVQDEEVVIVGQRQFQTAPAIGGDIDGVALGFQPLFDEVSDFVLVLNH